MSPRETLTVRRLVTRSGYLLRCDAAIFALLAIWAFAPLVVLLLYVGRHGGVLIGTNGADYFDQFQYLAWIRDEGSHLLASNLWLIGGTPHDYVQPMYLISGLLWRLGVGIQLAYLVWKPIALLVLFLGFSIYIRRMLPEGRAGRAAALALALFYESPLLAIATWTGHLSDVHRLNVVLATDDATSALNLWGFEHAAIAIGLMPIFLIGVEKLLAIRREEGRVDGRWTAIAAVAGLLVSWLHPWQGAMLLAIVAGLWMLGPARRRHLALLVPVAATVLPLVYGVALSRWDPSWRIFQSESTLTGTAPWWALLASFGPLAAFAALGIRRPREDREWILLLWLVACVLIYFAVPEFPPHALAGLTLPLAVLAVRGWRRVRPLMRVPNVLAAALALAAILAVTVPSVIFHANSVRSDVGSTVAGGVAQQEFRLTAAESASFDYLDHAPRAGGVLAPWLLSLSIPGFTGRAVYAGHGDWQPSSHVALADEFFDRHLQDPGGSLRRSILERSGAAFVLTDCTAPEGLAQDLKPLAHVVRRFGCVTVYEVN